MAPLLIGTRIALLLARERLRHGLCFRLIAIQLALHVGHLRLLDPGLPLRFGKLAESEGKHLAVIRIVLRHLHRLTSALTLEPL